MSLYMFTYPKAKLFSNSHIAQTWTFVPCRLYRWEEDNICQSIWDQKKVLLGTSWGKYWEHAEQIGSVMRTHWEHLGENIENMWNKLWMRWEPIGNLMGRHWEWGKMKETSPQTSPHPHPNPKAKQIAELPTSCNANFSSQNCCSSPFLALG
jgi:hypothetical protein